MNPNQERCLLTLLQRIVSHMTDNMECGEMLTELNAFERSLSERHGEAEKGMETGMEKGELKRADCESESLLPCPFCGGKAGLDDLGPFDRVMCRTCGAQGLSQLKIDKTTVPNWNRRANPAYKSVCELAADNPGLQEYLAQLEKERDELKEELEEADTRCAHATAKFDLAANCINAQTAELKKLYAERDGLQAWVRRLQEANDNKPVVREVRDMSPEEREFYGHSEKQDSPAQTPEKIQEKLPAPLHVTASPDIRTRKAREWYVNLWRDGMLCSWHSNREVAEAQKGSGTVIVVREVLTNEEQSAPAQATPTTPKSAAGESVAANSEECDSAFEAWSGARCLGEGGWDYIDVKAAWKRAWIARGVELDVLETAFMRAKAELAQVLEERDRLDGEVYLYRHFKSIKAQLDSELARLSMERNELRAALDHAIHPAHTDEKRPPAEKLWCAACGKWGNHTSGGCPHITHPTPAEEAGKSPDSDLATKGRRVDGWVRRKYGFTKVWEFEEPYGPFKFDPRDIWKPATLFIHDEEKEQKKEWES